MHSNHHHPMRGDQVVEDLPLWPPYYPIHIDMPNQITIISIINHNNPINSVLIIN